MIGYDYRTSDYLRIAVLALLYSVLARLVLSFFSANGIVSIIWLPSGLAVAALLLGGRKYWPGVFIGAFAASLIGGGPVSLSLAVAFGSTLEVLVCHWMLVRIDSFDPNLIHPRDFLRLSIAGMLSACISALIGVSALILAGHIAQENFLRNLIYWWQGDAISIILFTPLLIVWRQLPKGWFNRSRVLETISCFGLAFLTAQIICQGLFLESIGNHIRSYWMVLFVVWAAVRFGLHGALLVVSTTTVLASLGAIERTGIFAGDFGVGGLVNVWFYTLALTLTGVTLALAIERERKLNEAALNSSEERLRIAADSGQVAIWEVDLKSGKLIWDDNCFTLYKMQRENFRGSFEEWAARLHPDDLEATVAAFQEAAAGGEEYNTTFRIIWPDGEVRHIKAHGRLIKDKAGNPARMIGTNWDNWALVKSQQQLQLAQTTIDLSRSAFYRVSPAGRVEYVNDAACQNLGYSRKELIGMNVWDFDPDFPAEAWSPMWEGLLQTKVVNIETRHQRKDGTIFPVEVVGNIINDGGDVYSFVFVQDITERKNAEEALRASEAILSATISSSLDAVVHMNAEGIITRWNAQAEKIFDWPRDEAVGRKLHETIIPLRYRDAHIRGMKHFMASGEGPVLNSRIEISALHRDGHEFPVELSITPLKTADNYEFSAFIRDISERKQAGERIQRLTHLYRSLSEVNQAIVRMEEQDELFPLVCRCAVEFGGMTMAWIGQVDKASGLIVSAASYGSHLEFLDGIVVSSNADMPEGRGPMGRALRENRSYIINDYLADPMTAPWRERAANCGWNSQGVFPIPRGGKPFAVIAVYHAQLSAFDKEAIALLEEMAKDISFALDNFDREVQRKSNEQSLQLAASVYEASSEAMLVMDAEGTIIAINPAYTAVTGYLKEDVLGKPAETFKSDQHDEAFYQAISDELKATGKWQGELWTRRKNGEAYPIMAFINDTFNQDNSVLHRIVLFNDISHIKQFNELIWRQANFDTLTGLPNRQMFQDRLGQEIKKTHRTELPLTLLFLDLDYFKEVNDTLGHAKGDMLLKEASIRLTNCARESDTVARFGGDEFTMLLSELHDTDSVDRVIQNILQALSEPFNLDGEIAYVSVSIGVTCYPDDGREAEVLLKNADQAMYAAKTAGRNGFSYYTPAMQATAQFRMRLANDLRGALSENQLWVAYQPIVDLKSGKIVKAEALVRWQHPKHGLVNPAEFIAVAEHTGLINDIGEFVFYEATQQAKRLQESYLKEFQISVNVSPVQINDKSGKHKPWHQQLKKLGLSGKSIVVEITEGLLLEANAATTAKLLEFRDAGIQVALDDFGTGYSSLSYLKKFDIDYIKIDRSFVRNLSPKSGDLALCEAMIVMAHRLELKVIAEGVETAEQHKLLSEVGCDLAQGYLFSKPVTAGQLEKLLQKS